MRPSLVKMPSALRNVKGKCLPHAENTRRRSMLGAFCRITITCWWAKAYQEPVPRTRTVSRTIFLQMEWRRQPRRQKGLVQMFRSRGQVRTPFLGNYELHSSQPRYTMAMSRNGRTGSGRARRHFWRVSVATAPRRFGKTIQSWITAKAGTSSSEFPVRSSAFGVPPLGGA
jgi:hypothetical protein